MDREDDTEPRKFFCFDGCLVNLKGKELEIQTAELMGGSVPRATYKFMAEGEIQQCFPAASLPLVGWRMVDIVEGVVSSGTARCEEGTC